MGDCFDFSVELGGLAIISFIFFGGVNGLSMEGEESVRFAASCIAFEQSLLLWSLTCVVVLKHRKGLNY